QPGSRIDQLSLNQGLFDHHGRRKQVGLVKPWVEDRNAVLCREPETSHLVPEACGLTAAVAFVREHAVALSITDAVDLLDLTVCEVVQLLSLDPVDPAVRTDPEIAALVFFYRED